MMRSVAFIGLFLVGALTMFLFDAWYTLLIGMALQLVAIVLGVFAIATPEFLSGENPGEPAPAPLAVAEEDVDEGGSAEAE